MIRLAVRSTAGWRPVMDAFVISGGRPLEGRISVNGSKNASLPILAAALLTDEAVTLRGIPDLADIANMLRLLGELGCYCQASGDALTLRTIDSTSVHARYDIVRTMRASVCVLGPLLAMRGHARVSMPGGCAIGHRPIDLHLKGLEALGARVTLDNGDIVASVPGGRLVGAGIFLGGAYGSTVLGTANVMSAATLARGRTVIESAACEPEVVDLAKLLNAMGARISGAGSPRIVIEGVDQLGGADFEVMADRIEAGTLMGAAAITGGDLVIDNCPLDAMMGAIETLRTMGVGVEPIVASDPMRASVRVFAGSRFRPVEITTQPHPGFPTDLQAQFMALMTLADGISVVTEKIFPERFLHAPELARMGATIHRSGSTAIIAGVKRLVGAPVMASDLRASAGLVLAGLAAQGETVINRVYHLDRGYLSLERRLQELGAQIERVDDRVLAARDVAV
jgi:UDP-N-acetylglucosamine 1-carboxyvinyltransferase